MLLPVGFILSQVILCVINGYLAYVQVFLVVICLVSSQSVVWPSTTGRLLRWSEELKFHPNL